MKNVLSYINRPLFGAEIKSWIAENTKQNEVRYNIEWDFVDGLS